MSKHRHIHHPDLIDEIERYCEARSLKKSQFGRLAVGDGSLVTDLKSGRELRGATIAKVRKFISSATQ